jgi:hypothetical protein
MLQVLFALFTPWNRVSCTSLHNSRSRKENEPQQNSLAPGGRQPDPYLLGVGAAPLSCTCTAGKERAAFRCGCYAHAALMLAVAACSRVSCKGAMHAGVQHL